MNAKLSIVIPVFNEAENIGCTLDKLQVYQGCIGQVLIVYDFDADSTLGAVDGWLKENKWNAVSCIKNKYGRGALNAIKTGFSVVQEEAVLVVMADMADDLSLVPHMVDAFMHGADVVCGSRYMQGGKQIGGPLLKGLLSRVAGVSLHYLTGIGTHDITNSFKLYRTSLLRSVTIESSGGFELSMELTVKACLLGKKIVELPSVWIDRVHGASRFKLFEWLPHYLYWYLLLLFKRGPWFYLYKRMIYGYGYCKKVLRKAY